MTLSRIENRGTLTGRLQRTSGGGGGVTNYDDLTGKPKINNVTVNGDKTGHEYNLANLDDIPTVPGVMTGATAETDGAAGLAPKPSSGEENKFLAGDGTWKTVSGGTSYSEITLFEQPYNTSFPSTITLSESYENFDALGFYFTKSDDSHYYDYLPVKIVSKETLNQILNSAISGRTNTLIMTGWQLSNSQFVRFRVDSTTLLTTMVSGGAWFLKKISGIKFG